MIVSKQPRRTGQTMVLIWQEELEIDDQVLDSALGLGERAKRR